MRVATSVRLLPPRPVHRVHSARGRADGGHRGRAHPHAARRHAAAHHRRRAHAGRLQVADGVHRRAHHRCHAAGARAAHPAHLRRETGRRVVHGGHAVRHGVHGRHVASVESRVAGRRGRIVGRLAGEHRDSTQLNSRRTAP